MCPQPIPVPNLEVAGCAPLFENVGVERVAVKAVVVGVVVPEIERAWFGSTLPVKSSPPPARLSANVGPLSLTSTSGPACVTRAL